MPVNMSTGMVDMQTHMQADMEGMDGWREGGRRGRDGYMWIDRQMDKWIDGLMDAWKDRQMDGLMSARVVGNCWIDAAEWATNIMAPVRYLRLH